ncbi:hypothetical protein ACIGB6_14915 [Paeniglutamicibacter gangotriensis]|uniref:hypothetical protein n=1 Tax=Paeniglutamicibacter gangotriensis TaxID=254787 RepID=UPI0037CBC349
MSDYEVAWDALAEAIGAAKGVSSGSITDTEHLTVDQRIEVAKVAALLSISQEISSLNPQNTSYRDGEGNTRNGWGSRTYDEKPVIPNRTMQQG